jgi:hypothetical protein
MTLRRLFGTCICVLVVTTAGAVAGPAPSGAPPRAAAGVESLDLSGPPDTTTLDGAERNPTPFVASPPQTVEGTVVEVAPTGKWIQVKTREGLVKVGLPDNVPYVRNGSRDGSLRDIKPGDRFYATVVTQSGPRAVYVVTDPPMNPWITWLGVPVLLLIAAKIWSTGRTRAVPVLPSTKPATG